MRMASARVYVVEKTRHSTRTEALHEVGPAGFAAAPPRRRRAAMSTLATWRNPGEANNRKYGVAGSQPFQAYSNR
jgi:hypothetical protein